MADLSDLNAAQSVKIAGAGSTGTESAYVDATSAGGLHTNLRNAAGTEVGTAAAPLRTDPTGTTAQPITDNGGSITVDGTVATNAEGSVTPGTVATKSMLGGMQYNTSAPAPTDGQQLALQSTSDGKLKVDASLTSGQLVPTITNKLRFRYAIADVTLPNTGVYQTIYTRSGTGLFFGVQMGFDNANVAIRLTIDGGVVFDLPLQDIKKFEFNDTTDGRMQMGGFLTAVGNFFDFSSRFAIPYSSSILIQAAVSDATAHKLKQYISIHTEDT